MEHVAQPAPVLLVAVDVEVHRGVDHGQQVREVLGAVHPRGPVNTLQMRECTTILMELYRKFLSIPPPQLLAVFHKCLESTLCCDTRQILNKQIKRKFYAFFLPATIRQLILASVISVVFKMLDLPSTKWLQRRWKFNLLFCWLFSFHHLYLFRFL